MPVTVRKGVVRLSGHCLVEEAMTLLEMLQTRAGAAVDLRTCKSLHTALLQVLVAARPTLAALPADPPLADIVRRAVGDAA
jgi:hypothetical protein